VRTFGGTYVARLEMRARQAGRSLSAAEVEAFTTGENPFRGL
jgi:hypothetical protein